MFFIDTHIHIYSKEFDNQLDSLIKTAVSKGVTKLYMPNVDITTIPLMLEIERLYPQHCVAMMGLHPCSVNQHIDESLHVIEQWLKKRKFVAIGEIGIDLYWDKTFLKQQQQAFYKQIQWAKQYNLPYIIHSRNAHEQVMEIIKDFKNDKLKAIFHCFSGNIKQAEEIISAGDFKLGIGGVVTFKNSGLDKVIEAIDLKNIVLETDAPYLAPTPFRGKRNEPEYLINIAQKIAEIKNISIEEVATITTNNANYVFQNN